MYQEYSRILAPIDGSKEAELAFKKAVHVAKRNNGALVIAHIIDTRAVQTPTGYEGAYTNELVEQASSVLNDYKTYAEKEGVQEVETIIDYGSPKVQIAKDLALEKEIDLIMIGATGLNAVERLFIGSVSEYVIRNAPCDVLIVRTDLENNEYNRK